MEANININVVINETEIVLSGNQLTGLEIKHQAIKQGLDIEEDFILLLMKNYGLANQVGNWEAIKLEDGLVFRAISCF